MAVVRLGSNRPILPTKNPENAGGSSPSLSELGLDRKQLFGGSTTAFRRVDRVQNGQIEVDGARIPKGLVKGDLKPGQWLRFDLVGESGVKVSVDLKATAQAESRLADLFQTLKKR